MKKKTLTVIGIMIAVTVITATTALALGGNYRAVNNTDQLPEKGGRLIAGEPGKVFGFGLNIDVQLTEEQKTEALRQVKSQLDEQVAEGRITQEQADKLYAAAEQSEFGISFKLDRDIMGEVFGESFIKGERMERTEMTDEMKAEMLEKTKTRLDELVAAGKITQEEANEMYEKMQSGDMRSFRVKRFKDGESGTDVEFDVEFNSDRMPAPFQPRDSY